MPHDSQASAAGRAPAAHGLAEGRVIDDLRLVRKLGEGAQGVVWEAHQSTFDRRVAVKLLPSTRLVTEAQVERFRREAEAAGRLTHPNIVATHAFKEFDGQSLIVQELISGGDLEQEIERRHSKGRSSRADDLQRWAADVTRSLAGALQFAHSHGVVHRDIKPGNVLLTEDGRPKLTDFGLAKVDDDRSISRSGVAVGTPHYMSPEQIRADTRTIDHRTDIYSLGAVLYRMLTAQLPFSGESRQGLLLDILTRDPAPIRRLFPSIDRDLEAVCLKCLEKEPADRYADAQALADDLQHWQDGLGTSARPASVVSIPFRRMRRQATASLVFLSMLVPVALLAVDAAWLRGAAAEDPRFHATRQAAVVLATLLFMWPFGVLARRLSGGRAWARVPAVLAAVALGGAASWSIRGEHLDQLRTASRRDVQRQIENAFPLQLAASVDQHVRRWVDQFDVEDLVAVAHAYVSLGRILDAEDWLARVPAQERSKPLVCALEHAVASAVGDLPRADAALARLLTLHPTGAERIVYRFVGDLLREAGRYELAIEAYEEASYEEGSNRSALDFGQAKARFALCDYDNAWNDVRAAMRYRTLDMALNLLAFRIAMARGDRESAQQHLAALEPEPLPWLLSRYEWLLASKEPFQAKDFLLEQVEVHESNAQVLASIGALLRDRNDQDDALRVYERLALLEDGEQEGRIGLAAVALGRGRQGLAEGRPAEAAAAFASAREQLEFVLNRDPRNDIALYNLAEVRISENFQQYGLDTDAWPAEAWQAWLDALQASLALAPGRISALNNAAYALGRLHLLGAQEGALEQALALAHEAVRRTNPASQTRCRPGVSARAEASSCLDTLSSLREWGGDVPGGLEAAEQAEGRLAPGDPDLPRRAARVAALRARLSSGG